MGHTMVEIMVAFYYEPVQGCSWSTGGGHYIISIPLSSPGDKTVGSEEMAAFLRSQNHFIHGEARGQALL